MIEIPQNLPPAPTAAPTDAPETQPTAVPEAKPTKEPVTPPEAGDQAQLGLYLALAAAAAGDAPLMPDFSHDEKSGKESPKAGPSPALWNPPRGTGCPCVLLFAALSLVRSYRWHGSSFVSASFYGK